VVKEGRQVVQGDFRGLFGHVFGSKANFRWSMHPGKGGLNDTSHLSICH